MGLNKAELMAENPFPTPMVVEVASKAVMASKAVTAKAALALALGYRRRGRG